MPQNATNGNLRIMTITKALTVLILVGTLAYCTAMQIPIEGTVTSILLGVLGLKELVSAKVYWDTSHDNR